MYIMYIEDEPGLWVCFYFVTETLGITTPFWDWDSGWRCNESAWLVPGTA
jgi:hypothetical protein